MGYLIIGLLMGIVTTLTWQKYYQGKPLFQPLFERELLISGELGRLHALKKRVESAELRLSELEKDLPKAVFEEPSVPLKVVAGGGAQNTEVAVTKTERKALRKKVLKMWGQGSSLNKIATLTGLGAGEVELIISLEKQRPEL